MTFIRVYDRDFKICGEIDDVESLVIDRDFFGAGAFELHLSYRQDWAQLLDDDKFLLVNNRPDRVLLAEDVAIFEAGQPVKVRGVPLLGCLNRRIVVPPGGDNYWRFDDMPAEEIMHMFITSQMIDPTDSVRRVENMMVYPSSGLGEVINWRASFDSNLMDVLHDIGVYADLGHQMYMDMENKKLVYRVMAGNDLTTAQKLRPPVVFSSGFDNITGVSYEKKGSEYKNSVYTISGNIEENDFMRYIDRDYKVSGLDLKEYYHSVNADSIYDLVFETARRLKVLSLHTGIEAQILDTNSFRYEQDWDLGDIVTIIHEEAGKVMHERITQVREIYEYTGSSLELRFGLQKTGVKQRIEELERRVKNVRL